MSLTTYCEEIEKEGVLFNATLEHTASLVGFKDLSGRFVRVNAGFCKLFSLTELDIVGKTEQELFQAVDLGGDLVQDQIVIERAQAVDSQIELALKNGQRTFLKSTFPLLTEDGEVCGVGCILTDVTQQKLMEKSHSLAQRVVKNISEAVVFTDAQGLIVDVNDSYVNITGYDRKELIGKNPSILKSGRHDQDFYKSMWAQIKALGHWSGEVWDRRKNGEVYPKWLSIYVVTEPDGSSAGYVGIFNDLSEQKKAEKKLEDLSFYDPLTKLPNRVLFRDRLTVGISVAKRDQCQLAVLMIDLDRFKIVNDSLGHNAGDELLELIAKRFVALGRESDTVARLGGDEFAILLPELSCAEDASIVAQNFIDELQAEFKLKQHSVNIGASIGISIFPNDGMDSDALVKHAELALYKAKDKGRNNYQYFSQELQDAVFDQVALEDEMRKAISNQQFSLYYQPKISLVTRKIIGMEALVRWIHPEKGLIPPDKFIPFAEESGLIIPLGEWIIQTACREAAEWSRKFNEPLVVAINLSPKQFQLKDLLTTIKKALSEFQLESSCVELEITESCVMEDVEGALNTMKAFREHGLKLAIDDFGTGYSSLSYLKRFPINTLKIDQSFVRDLTVDSDDAAIVEAVISMADKLGLDVVAEGVETAAQLAFLSEKGCQSVQGYFLSRPLPTSDFESFLKKSTEE